MRKLRLLFGGLLGLAGLCSSAGAQTLVPGQWAWVAGSSSLPGSYSAAPGAYGTLGTPASGNTPGGRNYAQSWTDSSGNLWLFGGLYSSSSQWSYFNDLWKFDPVAREWTWMNGSSTVGTTCPVVVSNASYCGRGGTYGAQGTPAASNTPGGRYHAATWTDSSGNFWLYGGLGFDSNGNWGALSDLWQFNPSTNQWAWMSGNNTVPVNASCNSCILGQNPVPGTLGVPAAGNTPGGLWDSSTWTDANGNFWLFGGFGYSTTAANGAVLNDLWQFNPTTSEWAWMGGSSTFGSTPVSGTYGTEGQSAAANIPGSRWSEATWTDATGNLWLFGGQGYDSANTEGVLNDMWRFTPSTGQWAWIDGSSTLNCPPAPQTTCFEPGVYGTLGAPAATDIPGSRSLAYSWKDVNGNLWLFGGQGYGADSVASSLNDLWIYSPAKNAWGWISGDSTVSSPPSGGGVYGTLGTSAPGNLPGRRSGGVSWTDKNGNFWLWGGVGLDAALTVGYLNDLWVYQPPTALGLVSTSLGFKISDTAVSVAAGATTGNTSTITVTPGQGFTGSVALTAALTSSPGKAVALPTFSFSPASVSITGTGAATSTLTVTTTASTTTPCTSSNQVPRDTPWRTGGAAALAGLLLFVIPKRNRAWRSLLGLAVGFMVLSGAVGCGGSSSSGSSVSTAAPCVPVTTVGTTAGTYVLTVTGISGAIEDTQTVTVTVQ